jgi:hypothetical protein
MIMTFVDLIARLVHSAKDGDYHTSFGGDMIQIYHSDETEYTHSVSIIILYQFLREILRGTPK